jgi:hypothetical protein
MIAQYTTSRTIRQLREDGAEAGAPDRFAMILIAWMRPLWARWDSSQGSAIRSMLSIVSDHTNLCDFAAMHWIAA